MRIRAFSGEGDEADAVARINALFPWSERHDFEARTGAELRDFDRGFDPRRYVLRRYVAEEEATGRIVGYGHCFHTPWAFDPRRFWAAVRCDPAYFRRGVGGLLFARVMAELDALGAVAVRMEARETDPAMVGLLERRGFTEVLRSWEFALDPRGFDAAPFQASLALTLDEGIAITTLPEEIARDPGWLAKVHALYVDVTADVPLPDDPNPARPPDRLDEHLRGRPSSLPDACFLAKEGERLVGLCVLHRSEAVEGQIDHLLTGVRKEHRGHGVAMALKLCSIEYAARHGYARILTWVESNNPGMLALNKKLGFEHAGGLVLMEKDLGGGRR